MKKYPQVMENVKVSQKGKDDYLNNAKIKEKIEEVNNKLNGDGRILVRASGTENLIRVMLEGSDINLITKLCHELSFFIGEELN